MSNPTCVIIHGKKNPYCTIHYHWTAETSDQVCDVFNIVYALKGVNTRSKKTVITAIYEMLRETGGGVEFFSEADVRKILPEFTIFDNKNADRDCGVMAVGKERMNKMISGAQSICDVYLDEERVYIEFFDIDKKFLCGEPNEELIQSIGKKFVQSDGKMSFADLERLHDILIEMAEPTNRLND